MEQQVIITNINKSNFIYKLTNSKKLVPLITSIYILFIIFYINMNLYTNNYNNYFFKKNYIVDVNTSQTKPQYSFTNLNDAVSYISDNQILSRQINNNNFQNYIVDIKNSVLKLKDFVYVVNKNSYSYTAYGDNLTNDLKTKSINRSVNYNLNINKKKYLFFARIPNNFTYNGERFDANTKLQYLQARFYFPRLKRFISQDNYDLLNKFNYVNANPIMRIDPTGNTFINFSHETDENNIVSQFFLVHEEIYQQIEAQKKDAARSIQKFYQAHLTEIYFKPLSKINKKIIRIVIKSTSGLSPQNEHLILPNRLATYKKNNASIDIEDIYDLGSLYSANSLFYAPPLSELIKFVKEIRFSNCANQALCATKLLIDAGFQARVLCFANIDHAVAAVYGNDLQMEIKKNTKPLFIVDPWRGEVLPFSIVPKIYGDELQLTLFPPDRYMNTIVLSYLIKTLKA